MDEPCRAPRCQAFSSVVRSGHCPHSEREHPMRIGHCQLETKCGDFEGNLAKVVKGLERADRERVEVVCFPECFLTGYPDKEVRARKVAFAADSPQMMQVLDRTSRFEATLIVGF